MPLHKDLYNEVKKHYNEICVDYLGRLVRLVGCGETDSDWYYIVQTPHSKVKHWLCASGELIYLNNIIQEVEYNRLERMFVLEGVPPNGEVLNWKFNS